MITDTIRFMRPALLSLALLITATAFSQSVNLKLNLTKGETFPYVYDFTIDQEQATGPLKMVMLFGIRMVVKEELDTARIVECTFDRYKMGMHGEQINLDADTDIPVSTEDVIADPAKVVARIFQAFKGQHFSLWVNNRGDLVKLEGFDKIMSNIVDSAAVWFHLDDDMKAQMKQNMGNQFSDASMKDMMKQSFNIFPGRSLQVGDTWTKSTEANLGVGVKTNTTYTLKEIGKETATLSAQGKLSTTDAAGNTMSGDQQSTIVVDLKTGMIVESKFEQKLSGESNGSPSKMTSHGRIFRTDMVK